MPLAGTAFAYGEITTSKLMNNKAMTPTEGMHESTYALLMRSEEKQRSILEIVVFTLFILSAIFSLWQFAGQSVAFPLSAVHSVDSSDSAKSVQHCEARS